MQRRNKRRAQEALPCKEVASDDGIDPRYYFRPSQDETRHERKTLQLCAQVARSIQLALAGACGDPRLQSLWVAGVEPAPDASALRVRVQPMDDHVSLPEIQQRLDAVAARLRAAVASSIHRKRVPELLLVAVPRGEDT